jgi:hypothetical protein
MKDLHVDSFLGKASDKLSEIGLTIDRHSLVKLSKGYTVASNESVHGMPRAIVTKSDNWWTTSVNMFD